MIKRINVWIKSIIYGIISIFRIFIDSKFSILFRSQIESNLLFDKSKNFSFNIQFPKSFDRSVSSRLEASNSSKFKQFGIPRILNLS
ncbi:hypothetical protein O9G_004210 [Rozella allomycis CSF55]|uniref:Uncharacterized protein n=1 Tax=Rozella allomycis (strain CSF55) TaxID=988480 RepID=A0A075AYK3_ROZAC|nr:hypothetical protein O9G_004210 [Rozella allomycis CSF55]|eukprot:EPZ35199.1 hypothetical protein O9G_004210 [Rozella allomycis CSF55]